MLRKVESTSDVVDLSLTRVVQHSPFSVLCLAYAYTRFVSQIDGAVRANEHAHAYDDHYLTRSKFNSLLTEMSTPQTYMHTIIYIYIQNRFLYLVYMYSGLASAQARPELYRRHEHYLEHRRSLPVIRLLVVRMSRKHDG